MSYFKWCIINSLSLNSIFFNTSEINKKFNTNYISLYTCIFSILILYILFFGFVFLSDSKFLLENAAHNKINSWHLLGGYYYGRFANILGGEFGLVSIQLLFLFLSISYFIYILDALTRIDLKKNLYFILVITLSPLLIFSNVIFRDNIITFLSLLIFSNLGFLIPSIILLFRIDLALFLLVFNFFLLKNNKTIGFLSFIFILFLTIFLINSEGRSFKSLIHSYEIGINIYSSEIIESEIKDVILNCKEFETVYESFDRYDESTYDALISFGHTILLKPKAFFFFSSKKVECALINYRNYFITPSATYRVNNDYRDYLIIIPTQFSPLNKPIFILMLLLPGMFNKKTRLLLICGFLFSILTKINQEYRYSIPFILFAIIHGINYLISVFDKLLSSNR